MMVAFGVSFTIIGRFKYDHRVVGGDTQKQAADIF